jgi:hypothetical protein
LSDSQRERIAPELSGKAGDPGGSASALSLSKPAQAKATSAAGLMSAAF